MKKGEIEWLSTGENGVFRLDIPVLTFGNKGPKLVITSAVHGDEPIGVVIMSQLANYLSKKELKGTVSLVLAANPAAQFISNRVSPQDLKDLNRVGKGNFDGYYTDRLGAKLFDFFRTSDFVVNIHEFEMHTPVTTFFLGEGTEEVKKSILQGVKKFSPEIVWIVKKTNERDNQYKNTLDAALAIEGIPSFIIETVQLPFISDIEINNVVEGLINLIKHLGIIKDENAIDNGKPLSFYYRYEFTSDFAGYWQSQGRELLSSINEGDLIGTIKTFPYFEEKHIYAPITGKLLQFRHRELVKTGSSLFSIGVENDYYE